MNSAVPKKGAQPPSFGRSKNLATSPSPAIRSDLTLDGYMESDPADTPSPRRRPNERKKTVEPATCEVNAEIDSIVLNAPVGDVYVWCSRFDELPRFITSLQEVQRIDETHFSVASVLDNIASRTVLQIVLRVPERRIAWRAMSDDFPRGVILFEQLSDRSTKMTVRLRCSMQSSQLAKVTQEYLANFKQFVEQHQ